MSHVFTPAKEQLMKGLLILSTHDMRIAMCMTNTTADTAQDAGTLSALTLDECDGTNYARKTLTGEAVNRDDPNDRAEFDADDISWTNLGAGTRQNQGLLLYRHVDGTAANDIPVAWIDTGGFPFSASGASVSVQFNVEGIVQLT